MAEDKGCDAVFMSEAMNDALAGIEAIALATNRIQVGTWIANIICAIQLWPARLPRRLMNYQTVD